MQKIHLFLLALLLLYPLLDGIGWVRTMAGIGVPATSVSLVT